MALPKEFVREHGELQKVGVMNVCPEVARVAGYDEIDLWQYLYDRVELNRKYLGYVTRVVQEGSGDLNFDAVAAIIISVFKTEIFKDSKPYFVGIDPLEVSFSYSIHIRDGIAVSNPITVLPSAIVDAATKLGIGQITLDQALYFAGFNHDLLENFSAAMQTALADFTNKNYVYPAEQVVANVHNRAMALWMEEDIFFRYQILSQAVSMVSFYHNALCKFKTLGLEDVALDESGKVGAETVVKYFLDKLISNITYHLPINEYADEIVPTAHGISSLNEAMNLLNPNGFRLTAENMASFMNKREFIPGRAIKPEEVDEILYNRDYSAYPLSHAFDRIKEIIDNQKLVGNGGVIINGLSGHLVEKAINGSAEYDLSHLTIRKMDKVKLSTKCFEPELNDNGSELDKKMKYRIFEELGGDGAIVDTTQIMALVSKKMIQSPMSMTATVQLLSFAFGIENVPEDIRTSVAHASEYYGIGNDRS
jgi:hypothetical protein